jgi:aminoglycoside phosphotransferase (APT) family kinase protein
MERQGVALAALAGYDPVQIVADRVPWVITRGRSGLAEWSFERRLAGRPAPSVLGDGLLADCLDFLVALHHTAYGTSPSRSLVADAEVVADLTDSEAGKAIRSLGVRLEDELADVTRGFAHGDFWSGNLLASGGALRGVVDWDVAAAGCLPALDLLQLRLSEHRAKTRQYVGVAVVEHLLPWARSGGDDLVRSYARRVGLALEPGRLEALALAFWLDYVSHELRKYGDRAGRPVWVRDNISVVVDALR